MRSPSAHFTPKPILPHGEMVARSRQARRPDIYLCLLPQPHEPPVAWAACPGLAAVGLLVCFAAFASGLADSWSWAPPQQPPALPAAVAGCPKCCSCFDMIFTPVFEVVVVEAPMVNNHGDVVSMAQWPVTAGERHVPRNRPAPAGQQPECCFYHQGWARGYRVHDRDFRARHDRKKSSR